MQWKLKVKINNKKIRDRGGEITSNNYTCWNKKT